jgi:hypothetical protein
MIRVKISQTVLDDEYTIFGSELSNNNSGMTIRIFGSKISNYSCLRLSSLPKLLNDYEPERYSDGIELSRKLIELYDKRNLLSSLDSEPIFKRLVNAYKRNLIDESLHTGVKFIESDIVKNLPKKFVDDIINGDTVTVTLANKEELELFKIAARCILYELKGNFKLPQIQETEKLHQWLVPLAKGSDIHVISAVNSSQLPKYAKSFILDEYQGLSSPPPVVRIPNNDYLCYAVSTLTVLLSVPSLTEKLKIIIPEDLDNIDFFNILRTYIWTLSNGGMSEDQLKILNDNLAKHPFMSSFIYGEADDSLTFAKVLVNIIDEYVPIIGIYNIPELQLLEKKSIKEEIVTENSPNTLETTSDNEWTCAYDKPITRKIAFNRQKYIYEILLNSECIRDTFDKLVEQVIPDEDLPEILLLSHDIDGDQKARVCAIPSDIKIHGKHYSFHGATMFDNTYSDGHYICLIASETTMYFYDSQYRENEEDPREYRPRLLCYVNITKL